MEYQRVFNNLPVSTTQMIKMPMLARECLALKFRQNWMAKHPIDIPNTGGALDDSLTSLSWLQNLNIMKALAPTPPASPEPDNQTNIPDMRVNPNAVLNMPCLNIKQEPGSFTDSFLSGYSLFGGMEVAPPMATSLNHYHERIDYKANATMKPPYSYATLICMAMRESKKNKITLAGIYTWITDNFMYYRLADPSWQNSIRHNLSLNKCFQKVPRRKDEPGKGGFWRINPEYSDMFVNGIFKKRRNTSREPILTLPSPTKRIKTEPSDEGFLAAMTISNDMQKTRDDADFQNSSSQDIADQCIIGSITAADDKIVKSDFNWNAIFHQDIEVSGVRIKTEDIIDAHEEKEADSEAERITSLSPPPSDSNSDVALEDLLNPDFGAADFDGPLDLSTGGDLDLTITGNVIRPPDWWSESINRGFLSPEHNSSGLNTPIVQSPVRDAEDNQVHPWAENRTSLDDAIANFDLDLQNLFEEDTIGAQSLSDLNNS